jgi:hypothetical protein
MSDVGIIAVLFTVLIFAIIIIYRTGGTQHDDHRNYILRSNIDDYSRSVRIRRAGRLSRK